MTIFIIEIDELIVFEIIVEIDNVGMLTILAVDFHTVFLDLHEDVKVNVELLHLLYV